MSGFLLIVEDDDEIRELLAEMLEDEGFATKTAQNGAVALGLLRSLHRPCLVLLDLMMPVMTGWELLDALAGDPLLGDVRVAVLSGAADADACATRVAYVLKKPVDKGALIRAVNESCRHA